MKKQLSKSEQQDYEANVFAVCLLIPKDKLIEELDKMEFDLGDEKNNDLKKLCKTFGVSVQAMAFRLSILKKNENVR